MAVIGYQSFESSSSKTHDVGSIFQRMFTQGTNKRVTGAGVQALVNPSNPDMPAEIYQGPAELKAVQALDLGLSPTLTFLKGHFAQVFQNAYRNMGENIAVLVCGEIDVTGAGFDAFRTFPNLTAHVSHSSKNNQCFTGFVDNSRAGTIAPIAGDIGYYAFNIENMVVAFVHVPNAIANDKRAAASFYTAMQSVIAGLGFGPVDIVMGDTNQQRLDFTRECVQGACGGNLVNATAGGSVSPVDNYQFTDKGTNSGGSAMYDVCVYNANRVSVDAIAYLSQSSTARTVTDHMLGDQGPAQIARLGEAGGA